MPRAALVATALLACAAACGGSSDEEPAAEPVPVGQVLPAALRDLDPPPAPVLSPAEALAAFRVAPGFRVELVAAEPLVEDPVAIDWDTVGRLYAVEMRGYMPTLDGDGEDEPVGRVVVLEDGDGDGAMDTRHVFLDGLVLPRALAVLPQGVLIAAPPDLWLCRDRDADLACTGTEKTRVGEYAVDPENVEHAENGLLSALDNWIYNARSTRRLRFEGEVLRVEESPFRGQWGIDQDDRGRLYYNDNSRLLAVDLFGADLLRRHPDTDPARIQALGVNVDLAPDAVWHPVRVTPGVNRAYIDGNLRPDGRQARPTGVSGLAVYRGDHFGAEYAGDVFVPDVAVNAVARLRVREDGLELRAEHVLYPDAEWGKREFLASTDERFRPVDAAVGPDGALYVIDMYRGIIQHVSYHSPYLRRYIAEQGLAAPLGHGRIWRVVREGRAPGRPGPDLARADAALRVATLAHPNGFWRDAAQRWLVASADPAAVPLLRASHAGEPRARLHALFALAGLSALDAATLRHALADPAPAVRAGALHAGAHAIRSGALALDELAALSADPDPGVRLALLLALGERRDDPDALRALERALEGDLEHPLFRQAALSGLAGREGAALRAALARAEAAPETPGRAAWLRALARVHTLAFLRGDRPADELATWLGEIDALPASEARRWRVLAVLLGVREASREPDLEPRLLAARPALFSPERLEREGPLGDALRAARAAVTWPGDEHVPGTIPLTAAQKLRVERGRELYGACATCHQADGRGRPGIAPSLVDSPWVLDADGWLVRIALHGLAGPVRVHGEEWNLVMPGHAADPRFDDEAVASVLSYVRRAFGSGGRPIDPETVARVRAEDPGRAEPWTVEELHALPVEHRLDRFEGRYRLAVGFLPVSIDIERERTGLRMRALGQGETVATLGSDGLFHASYGRENVSFRFEDGEDGSVAMLVLHRGGTTVEFDRVK